MLAVFSRTLRGFGGLFALLLGSVFVAPLTGFAFALLPVAIYFLLFLIALPLRLLFGINLDDFIPSIGGASGFGEICIMMAKIGFIGGPAIYVIGSIIQSKRTGGSFFGKRRSEPSA